MSSITGSELKKREKNSLVISFFSLWSFSLNSAVISMRFASRDSSTGLEKSASPTPEASNY